MNPVQLPTNQKLVGKLRQAAFLVNLTAVLVLGIAFWGGLIVPLGTAILFLIITGATIFHATESSGDKTKRLFMVIPVITGLLVAFVSSNLFWLHLEAISFYSWISFLCVGAAISIPYLKIIAHRFHPAQLLAFFTLVPNLMSTLGMINVDRQIFFVSLIFTLESLAILLRWPGRGFMSVFTIESVSSKLAFKLLAGSLVLVPVIGCLAIVWGSLADRSVNEIAALITASVMAMMIILIWINIRAVKKTELNNLLFKEELVELNTDLKQNNASLANQMEELEKVKQELADRLNYQDKFRDIAEGLG